MAYATKSAGYARNAGKRWRGEDVKLLKALARQGASLRLISLKLGRPDSAIRAKATTMGLELKSPSPVVAPPPSRTLSRLRTPAQRTDFESLTRQPDLFGHA